MKTIKTVPLTNWLLERPIAHRGLHGASIPENSIAAFGAAIAKNYAIELDIQWSADNNILVCHDSRLSRVVGLPLSINNLETTYIKKLRLCNTNTSIPTLSEALDHINGRSGLIIEVKGKPPHKVINLLIALLNSYKHDVAIHSIEPSVIRQLKQHLQIPIGLVFSRKESGIMSYFNSSADFISSSVEDLKSYRVCSWRNSGKKVFSWTVTKNNAKFARQHSDNIIFEGYLP